MTSSNRRARLLIRAAALAACGLLTLTACSDTTSRSKSDGTSIPTAGGNTVAGDPKAALQQGLAALETGYHFIATVTVNGTESLQAVGDRVGDSSRLDITSAGATVAYVISPAGNYARPTDGEWERLDVPPATSDPINGLRAPVAVTALDSSDGTLRLTVTVSAIGLGIATEGNVDVQVVLRDGALVQITYTTPVQGGEAQVITDIGPLTDTTPITTPF